MSCITYLVLNPLGDSLKDQLGRGEYSPMRFTLVSFPSKKAIIEDDNDAAI